MYFSRSVGKSLFSITYNWVAEPACFVGNGPLLDNKGNLYFSPQFFHGERVALVPTSRAPPGPLPLFAERESTAPNQQGRY